MLSFLSPYWFALDFWNIEFEKLSLTNLSFCLFQTGFLCSLQKLCSNWEKQVHQTWHFKNQIQIDREGGCVSVSERESWGNKRIYFPENLCLVPHSPRDDHFRTKNWVCFNFYTHPIKSSKKQQGQWLIWLINHHS